MKGDMEHEAWKEERPIYLPLECVASLALMAFNALSIASPNPFSLQINLSLIYLLAPLLPLCSSPSSSSSSSSHHCSAMEKSSVVEAPVPVRAEDEHGSSSALRTSEFFLRLLPIGLSVAALVLMLNKSQANDYGSLSYTDLVPFRYLVHANGICAGYSLLSAAIVAMPRPSTMSRAWTFFLLDQVLTYIILSAGSVSTEALYLVEKGNTSTLWSSACGYFGRFCHKATASVSITFLAVVCYVLLSLISSYKLFSKFDPPATNPTAAAAKAIDNPAFHA